MIWSGIKGFLISATMGIFLSIAIINLITDIIYLIS
jgi:hypothetical protein